MSPLPAPGDYSSPQNAVESTAETETVTGTDAQVKTAAAQAIADGDGVQLDN